jgi:hypothetical protein
MAYYTLSGKKFILYLIGVYLIIIIIFVPYRVYLTIETPYK